MPETMQDDGSPARRQPRRDQGLDTLDALVLTQALQYHLAAGKAFAVEELVSPVADFLDYLARLPYAGRLVIHMAFLRDPEPPEAVP